MTDASNPAFAPVDLLTADLELDTPIYEGFAAAIMVKGQPRMVALCREFADGVQIMALIKQAQDRKAAEADGELGFDLYDEKCQLAMSWTLNIVGKMLGAKDWEGGDGSETVEGDVAAEIGHIMRAAGLVDLDGDMLTAESFAAIYAPGRP